MNQENKTLSRISVAPMMDWTDRHCRYFHRLISPNTLLYTEMKTTGALIHGDKDRFLRFHEAAPVALQLGGSDPSDLALCAKMGEDYGYNEINLNCGCPSDRVQKGKIGAILMEEPDLVAKCVSAMIKAVKIPVTVKCRIGIDERDDFEFLSTFTAKIRDTGCNTLIIHARKAWLSGLSPKENRTKPPINYQRVLDIKSAYPDMAIIMNGEIKTLEQIKTHLEQVEGVMVGREAYQNPYILAEIERKIFGNHTILGREKVAKAMIPYIEKQMKDYGTPVKSITRHMIGLFHHQPGAKAWKQALSTLPHQEGADSSVIEKALSKIKG